MTLARFVAFSVLLAALQPSPRGDQAADSEVAGFWLGVARVGVKDLRIVFDITVAAQGLRVVFSPIDQGGAQLPATNVRRDGRALAFDVPANRGAFAGTLDADGARLTGTWTQNGAEVRLELARADRSSVRQPRRQDPVPPFPYDTLDVTIPHDAAGLTLAGTLTLPRSTGPHAAVLLISGSGPQDRNQEVFGHRPFLVIADDLTRRGIAVLRVDDRGVGGSTGARDHATSEDYAGDALACVRFLERRPEIDARRIGLVGHSEGGLVAPMVAARHPAIAFVVLLAAPALPGADLSILQARTMLRAAGAPPEAIDMQTRIQRRVMDVLRESTDEPLVRARIRDVLTDELVRAGDPLASQLERVERQLEPQIRRALLPWSRFFMVYDPRPALAALRCPVLALNGTTDTQVPAAENLPALEVALRSRGNRDITVTALPGLNHLFQPSATGAVSEYATIDETFAPDALERIGRWLVARTREQTTP
jgi:pimeloyl-ACP methyl ester carboxylesterase